MNENFIYYFGYGANKDSDMMEAIIGRRPEGKPAKLRNFELCVQHWHEIGEEIKKELSDSGWNEKFKTYCIRQTGGKEVHGTLWLVTKDEHKHIGNWELHGRWYMPAVVIVECSGKIVEAITEIIDNKSLKTAQEIHGDDCPIFLNDKSEMLENARKDRSIQAL